MLPLNSTMEEVYYAIALSRMTGFNLQQALQLYRELGGAQAVYEHCIEAQRPVMIMFADMDDLKSINDNYGHKAGDYAIRSIATVLQEACFKDEITCRFGGDEFFIFGPDYSETEAVSLRNRIQHRLDICNRNSGSPYKLSISIGSYIAVPSKGSSVFQLITQADNIMYEEKKKKNPSKYLKQSSAPVKDA